MSGESEERKKKNEKKRNIKELSVFFFVCLLTRFFYFFLILIFYFFLYSEYSKAGVGADAEEAVFSLEVSFKSLSKNKMNSTPS